MKKARLDQPGLLIIADASAYWLMRKALHSTQLA